MCTNNLYQWFPNFTPTASSFWLSQAASFDLVKSHTIKYSCIQISGDFVTSKVAASGKTGRRDHWEHPVVCPHAMFVHLMQIGILQTLLMEVSSSHINLKKTRTRENKRSIIKMTHIMTYNLGYMGEKSSRQAVSKIVTNHRDHIIC